MGFFPSKMAASTKFAVLARNFSSSSVNAALVKPPIQVFGLEGRYASALYSASKQKSLKTEALASVAKKQNMTPLSANLLGMMAENGRLDKLDGVINSFKTIMAAYRGEVTCQVTSAKSLD